jgi:hypothetical protein
MINSTVPVLNMVNPIKYGYVPTRTYSFAAKNIFLPDFRDLNNSRKAAVFLY